VSPNLTQLIALLKLASLINRPMLAKVASPAGLALNELRLLVALAGEGRAAGHDLTNLMGMPPMAVSRAVAALRENGLVIEQRDNLNRRRKVLSLTRQGRARLKALLPEMQVVSDIVFSALSSAERRVLARVLSKLVHTLETWPD
jgi:DNA-binding MarR family transcriptional regulator